jgi:hypothetical protein
MFPGNVLFQLGNINTAVVGGARLARSLARSLTRSFVYARRFVHSVHCTAAGSSSSVKRNNVKDTFYSTGRRTTILNSKRTRNFNIAQDVLLGRENASVLHLFVYNLVYDALLII